MSPRQEEAAHRVGMKGVRDRGEVRKARFVEEAGESYRRQEEEGQEEEGTAAHWQHGAGVADALVLKGEGTRYKGAERQRDKDQEEDCIEQEEEDCIEQEQHEEEQIDDKKQEED